MSSSSRHHNLYTILETFFDDLSHFLSSPQVKSHSNASILNVTGNSPIPPTGKNTCTSTPATNLIPAKSQAATNPIPIQVPCESIWNPTENLHHPHPTLAIVEEPVRILPGHFRRILHRNPTNKQRARYISLITINNNQISRIPTNNNFTHNNTPHRTTLPGTPD